MRRGRPNLSVCEDVECLKGTLCNSDSDIYSNCYFCVVCSQLRISGFTEPVECYLAK